MTAAGAMAAAVVVSFRVVDSTPDVLVGLPELANDVQVVDLVRARVLWFLAITSLVVAELLALPRLLCMAKSRWTRDEGPKARTALLVGGALLAAGLGLFEFVNGCGIRALTAPIRDSLAPADAACSRCVTKITDAMAALTVAAVAFAFAGLLRRSRAEDPVRDLASRMRDSTSVLRTAAALLVLGVLEVAALFHWSVARFDPGSAERALVHDLATTVSLGVGGFFSLLLAAGYAPTYALLNERARELESVHNTGSTSTTRAEWLASRGLAPSGYLPAMQSVLSILGPLLAGSLGTAAEALRGLAGSG
jgi:hypothetical protein